MQVSGIIFLNKLWFVLVAREQMILPLFSHLSLKCPTQSLSPVSPFIPQPPISNFYLPHSTPLSLSYLFLSLSLSLSVDSICGSNEGLGSRDD